MNRPVRFGSSVLTVALLAAVAAAPCVAQDNHPSPEASTAVGDYQGVAGDAHSQPPRAENASGVTEKDGPAAASKSTNTVNGTDAVDARIAPPPSGGERIQPAQVRPINVPSPRNVLRRAQVIGVQMPAIRNTVGVTGHHGVTGITTPGPVTPPKFGQRAASANVKPITINNGALSGTGLARHTSAPASIGGPAPAVGGISGSSFRPKHTTRP
jgi:hypothetical protein